MYCACKRTRPTGNTNLVVTFPKGHSDSWCAPVEEQLRIVTEQRDAMATALAKIDEKARALAEYAGGAITYGNG